MTIEEWAKDFKLYVNELQIPRDDYNGIMEYIDDALVLLKEQEPKPVKVTRNAYNHEFYYCPRCDRSFCELFVKPKFCDKCGQAVKWE